LILPVFTSTMLGWWQFQLPPSDCHQWNGCHVCWRLKK